MKPERRYYPRYQGMRDFRKELVITVNCGRSEVRQDLYGISAWNGSKKKNETMGQCLIDPRRGKL